MHALAVRGCCVRVACPSRACCCAPWPCHHTASLPRVAGTEVVPVAHKGSEYCIELRTPTSRAFLLRAADEHTRNKWTVALRGRVDEIMGKK